MARMPRQLNTALPYQISMRHAQYFHFQHCLPQHLFPLVRTESTRHLMSILVHVSVSDSVGRFLLWPFTNTISWMPVFRVPLKRCEIKIHTGDVGTIPTGSGVRREKNRDTIPLSIDETNFDNFSGNIFVSSNVVVPSVFFGGCRRFLATATSRRKYICPLPAYTYRYCALATSHIACEFFRFNLLNGIGFGRTRIKRRSEKSMDCPEIS